MTSASRRERADDIVRTSADIRIVELVRDAGPSSIESRELETALRDFGTGAMMNLLRRGALFMEVTKQTGIRLVPPPAGYVEDLARLIVLTALVAGQQFMESAIFGGAWSPSAGASLRTYFVRRCLYTFVDEYKAFLREERSQAIPTDDVELAESLRSSRASDDPESVAVNRDTVSDLLATTPPDVVQMLLLTAYGYKQSEIAARLGITSEAVSSALRRFRQTQGR
ncbi:hypothetical protein [Actinomycetospora sp. CA-053990]|uniref:hypothetical protein n=1 Tax=Actinomycetospora sp. CA-053990 TaxID=3239891 RepID=UPI003D8BAC65